MILYVARDGDGRMALYKRQPVKDRCRGREYFYVPLAYHELKEPMYFELTPDQSAEFSDLPAGECWPVEVIRKGDNES